MNFLTRPAESVKNTWARDHSGTGSTLTTYVMVAKITVMNTTLDVTHCESVFRLMRAHSLEQQVLHDV